MSTPTEFITDVMALWTEPDAAVRQTILERRFTEQIRFHDHDGEFVGHEGLERFSAGLRERFPTARFELTGEPDAVGDAFRAFWRFGPPDKPDAVTGMDFVIWDGERASDFYAFVVLPGGG